MPTDVAFELSSLRDFQKINFLKKKIFIKIL